MIPQSNIRNIFFLGIGGIGMSALARYFKQRGYAISGYDRTVSTLTQELEKEDILVCYTDSAECVKAFGLRPTDTLVVRTPAVPQDNTIYTYLRDSGYDIRKRAEVLGLVTRHSKALCVAGTHGKTTTSTMLAHLMKNMSHDLSPEGGKMFDVSAFLGGISMNYGTNLLLGENPRPMTGEDRNEGSHYVVVEADEYDRSFHQLTPYISVVTAVDADHLDIYGTAEAYREAFSHYTSLITGALVMKQGIDLQPRLREGVKCYTYGLLDDSVNLERPDFYASNIRIGEGTIAFDFYVPGDVISDVQLGVPVWVNIENAVAAMAVTWLIVGNGDPKFKNILKKSIQSFKGVQRRFNRHVNTPNVVYIDDYAHHPQEIATSIDSIRRVYPGRKLIGIFQPHLYTRTRDFADDFARVLSTLDEVVLLPVYPAREEPIKGVDSEMLLEKIANPHKRLVQKNELADYLHSWTEKSASPIVILTIGAGDIDRLVPLVMQVLQEQNR